VNSLARTITNRASSLCHACGDIYVRWSHECLCRTYQLYTRRRVELSDFELGEWHTPLIGRDFQLSEAPYETFLESLGVTTKQSTENSWWRTEMDGWSGGQSESAKQVDVSVRRSYREGFYPVVDGIPPERHLVEKQENSDLLDRNGVGLLRIRSWSDYYRFRGLPDTSVAALLLTFPLTLYHALVEYGEVPCTVARMLQRPLRIHIVGAEKEIHFLDLFREVAFLLPNDISLELVFVVRHDMLPPAVRSRMGNKFNVDLLDRLRVTLVSGTYGGSLDPNFDCGSPPDMIMAFNAGLYAYESWRSVVNYLNRNSGVVGVFTDYNEFSGVQCASLGGASSRESVRMNPFRQPRAMPVYSMNLPQFSNGFLFVLNPQELE
jgi:hypothetical protein